MPKRKQLLKAKNKGAKHPAHEETADDMLDAGVKLEEAGEKWRGGDKAKSARFFLKALDTYEGGLERFPTSIDLLYNRYTALSVLKGLDCWIY